MTLKKVISYVIAKVGKSLKNVVIGENFNKKNIKIKN